MRELLASLSQVHGIHEMERVLNPVNWTWADGSIDALFLSECSVSSYVYKSLRGHKMAMEFYNWVGKKSFRPDTTNVATVEAIKLR